MNKIIFVLFVCILFSSIFSKHVFGSFVVGNSATFKAEAIAPDDRPQKLEKFLNFYQSPLSGYSSLIVKIADKYQIDWRLLAAIAGVESTFGKYIPEGSFNAYGWNNGDYKFNSWENSIDHVSSVLSEKYIKKGLNTPSKIAPVYCPPSNTWADKVKFFMEKLENFEETRVSDIELSL